jgi:ABC-2 type transport system ATP-binding protein
MGKTILISSHILTELADCCTSIGIVERGQLLMHGPMQDVYRQIRGNRMLRIKFLSGLEAGVSLIRSSPHTRNVQLEDHTCVVEFAGEDADVAALLQHLLQAGSKVLTFADKDPTLEDVFMMVTKGLVS